MKLVKITLNNTESAIFLSDMYDEYNNMPALTTADNLIGPVLYRSREDVSNYNRYDSLLDSYTKFDIQKFYGLNLNEYLDLTRYERTKIIEKATDMMIAISETMGDIESDIREKTNQLGDIDYG